MFAGQSAKYDRFRAQFKIWIPSLQTLDGIDFSKDEVMIADIRTEIETQKQQATGGRGGRGLATIPEENKAGGQTAGAAAGGASKGGA